MNFDNLVSTVIRHIDESYFKSVLEDMEKFLNQEILYCIPSMVTGAESPTLSSLFFVSKDFICEFRITGNKEAIEYDVIRLDTVLNIRIESSLQQIKNDEIVLANIYSAQVALRHIPTLETSLNFVGTKMERNEWLAAVRGIFKPSILVENRRSSDYFQTS